MSDCKDKTHQNRFHLGHCPRPTEGAYSALKTLPRRSSWNKGDLLLREGEGAEKGKGRRGKKKEFRERRGEGGKKRKERESGDSPYQC